MSDLPRTGVVALLDDSEDRASLFTGRIELEGRRSVLFTHPKDLLLSLSNGHRFDILIVGMQDDATQKSLLAACSVIGIPILFLLTTSSWKESSWRDWELGRNDVIDLEAARVSDDELHWRMRGLLHKKGLSLPLLDHVNPVSGGGYQFLPGLNIALHQGRQIHLQPRLFSLAQELFKNIDRVVSRDQLARAGWRGAPLRKGARVLDTSIAGLRKKLELRGEHGLVLRAVYREGYQIVRMPRTVAAYAHKPDDHSTPNAGLTGPTE